MEALLDRITSVASFSPTQTTLLDLCSGTGTLGLAFSKTVKEIIGIEMVPTAVENAKVNAQRNNVNHARYVCGKVEKELPAVLRNLTPEALTNVVAILDPPRCGVHPSVAKALRNVAGLKRIIYISCDQRALEKNCEPLTKPTSNNFSGSPFYGESAFGVDLFPQTPHVEMIVALKRR